MLDLAEESPGLAQRIIAVESSLPATFLYQRKHRVDRWCCDLHEAAQFLDGGDECIDLEGSASFEILQHRNFVTCLSPEVAISFLQRPQTIFTT
jgi:hypothetical protein